MFYYGKKDGSTFKAILDFIKANPLLSSKEVHERLALQTGYATLKRDLQYLISENLLTTTGKGKGTKYRLSKAYKLLYVIDAGEYFKKEIDERAINDRFNFGLITELLPDVSLFTVEELAQLNHLQKIYKENISNLTETEYKKELERLAIDLS